MYKSAHPKFKGTNMIWGQVKGIFIYYAKLVCCDFNEFLVKEDLKSMFQRFHRVWNIEFVWIAYLICVIIILNESQESFRWIFLSLGVAIVVVVVYLNGHHDHRFLSCDHIRVLGCASWLRRVRSLGITIALSIPWLRGSN